MVNHTANNDTYTQVAFSLSEAMALAAQRRASTSATNRTTEQGPNRHQNNNVRAATFGMMCRPLLAPGMTSSYRRLTALDILDRALDLTDSTPAPSSGRNMSS